MSARSIWQTVLLTAASVTAAVGLAAAGFVIIGEPRVDLRQGLTIAAVVSLILTPVFVFPLVRTQKHLRELTAQLRKLADEDDLTGLSNRRSFLSHVQADIERAGAERRAYAILMLDLDHFKTINDRFGHAAGDLVLTAVAGKTRQIVQVVAPSTGCVGRLGGEEFAIYLGGEEAANAVVLAEVLCQVIRDWAIHHARHVITLTASVGVAVVPCSTPLERALCLADDAAYRAKASGRDRWVTAPRKEQAFGTDRAA